MACLHLSRMELHLLICSSICLGSHENQNPQEALIAISYCPKKNISNRTYRLSNSYPWTAEINKSVVIRGTSKRTHKNLSNPSTSQAQLIINHSPSQNPNNQTSNNHIETTQKKAFEILKTAKSYIFNEMRFKRKAWESRKIKVPALRILLSRGRFRRLERELLESDGCQKQASEWERRKP